jgi:hypothetical protein
LRESKTGGYTHLNYSDKHQLHHMEKHTIFSAPHNSTEADAYKPFTKLGALTEQYLKLARETKLKMTPTVQLACGLTDLMALRAAELPETH